MALKKIFDAFQNATDAQVQARDKQRHVEQECGLHTWALHAANLPAPMPCLPALQRTFREIMFLQEMNNHENIIRCACMLGEWAGRKGMQPSALHTGQPLTVLRPHCYYPACRLLNVLKADNDRCVAVPGTRRNRGSGAW